MDPNEMRFRTQQSPRSDATTMNSLVSPRNRLSQTMSSQDPRSTLSRRFTTDSGRVPTLSTPIAQRGPDVQDYQVSYVAVTVAVAVTVPSLVYPVRRACLVFRRTSMRARELGGCGLKSSGFINIVSRRGLPLTCLDAGYATSSAGACALEAHMIFALQQPHRLGFAHA